MASIKKKSSGGGGANWMDTYGDMVTLLLCFFVLLYSISTVDQQKWMIVVKSFNRDAIIESEVPPGPVNDNTDNTGGDNQPATDLVEVELDELYEFLKNNMESNDVSISRGDGYVFISFADAVFFDGNSFALREEGAAILDEIIPALDKAGPYIDELQVLGHTAQQSPNEPNPILRDRLLAAQRSAVVLSYIQERIPAGHLDPGRLVDSGHGQWRNIAPNEDSAGRAKNRRVEIVVTGKNLENELEDNYQHYYTMYTSTNGSTITPD